MRRALLVSAFCAGCGHGATGPSAPAGASPERWPIPSGWRRERMDLPPDFAPRLARAGVEEIRFAPGFMDLKAPGFWSYAFVWWLDDDRPIDRASLSADLVTYFDGLADAVDADAHHLPSPRDPATVELDYDLHGELQIWDAFTSHDRLHLFTTVTPRRCGARRAIVFELSPAQPGAPIWRELDALAGAIDCPRIPLPPAPPPDHLPPL